MTKNSWIKKSNKYWMKSTWTSSSCKVCKTVREKVALRRKWWKRLLCSICKILKAITLIHQKMKSINIYKMLMRMQKLFRLIWLTQLKTLNVLYKSSKIMSINSQIVMKCKRTFINLIQISIKFKQIYCIFRVKIKIKKAMFQVNVKIRHLEVWFREFME
jgi:hypothetical protein